MRIPDTQREPRADTDKPKYVFHRVRDDRPATPNERRPLLRLTRALVAAFRRSGS